MVNRVQIIEQALGKLQESEGFSDKPYWDFRQLSIGYGSAVSGDELKAVTQATGLTLTQLLALGQKKCDSLLASLPSPRITRDQALARLRARVERDLKRLETLVSPSLKLTVVQYVALVDYLYNKGNFGPKATAALKAGRIVDLARELDIVTAGGRFHRVVYRRTIESVVELLLHTQHTTQLPDILRELQHKASKRPGYTA